MVQQKEQTELEMLQGAQGDRDRRRRPHTLFAAGLGADPLITGGLGVIVVILESMQGLFQFQQNWTNHRSTAEGLKHEKFLWVARAGPYKDPDNPTLEDIFAERVEALISTEHAKWATYQEQAGKQRKTTET